MEQNQEVKNISISEYLDSRIRMYMEIKVKAEGAIEALVQMKQNLVRTDDNEQEAQTARKENGNDDNGTGETPTV